MLSAYFKKKYKKNKINWDGTYFKRKHNKNRINWDRNFVEKYKVWSSNKWELKQNDQTFFFNIVTAW